MELCPTKPQAFDDHERQIIEMPEWRHIDDGDLQAIAQKVVAHGSALITGPAGTGKTWLNKLINSLLQGTVVNAAMTHAASRLMPGGKTIARLLNVNRYGRVRDTTFCVDEIGMVPLSTLVRLGSWQLLGSKFIMYGDFQGQFEPIYDQWRGDVESSGIVRQLAGGLHVHLTTGRRSDLAHFKFYTGLYAKVSHPAQSAVAMARAQYPWSGEQPAIVLCVSHKKRRRLNAFYNECRDKREGVLARCAAGVRHHNQPQDMYLKPGMRLLCACKYSRVLVNGVFYEVVAVCKKFVTVRMCEAYRRDRTGLPKKDADRADILEGDIVLSHRDASLALG